MKHYSICPSCSRQKLEEYVNNYRCHACGYYEKILDNTTTHLTPAKTMTQLQLPVTESFDWDSKGIPSRVLDLYGVGIDSNGRVVSPHYSPNMELLSVHTRTPGERDFRMQGSNVPVGLHTLGNNKELIICEGHSDTYAAKTMFPKCDVIGLPGSDTYLGLSNYMSYIRKYKRITIMVDNDQAGKKCQTGLLSILPKSKTYVTTLDVDHDVCSYLAGVDGHSTDELHKLYRLATSNHSGSFVTPEDCDKYATDKAYDVVPTGIKQLDGIMGGGLGVAELTLLSGYTGTGKSALTQQLAVNVAKSGTKVLYIAGEMTPKQNLDRLVRQWTGGVVRKDELAMRYKEVSSMVLITKFSDLTVSTVTDVIQEAVQDHGVRLVIIDVLSDIDGFLSTDMSTPAKIVKRIHEAARGNEMDDIPPCAVLCVAHTKGGDSEQLRADDIRGGSVIRQEATCILGISEVQQGDLTNTTRLVTLLKRPRNRDFTTDPVTLTYDKHSHRYTADEQLPVEPRKKLPLNVPSTSTPSRDVIPVGDKTETTIIPEVATSNTTTTPTPAKQISESVSPRFPQPNDEHLLRDEGHTTDTGQDEVTASVIDEPIIETTVSGTDVTVTEHPGTTVNTSTTEQSDTDKRLTVLRNMYTRFPNILDKHQRTVYKTNDAVRLQLIELGYELL